MLMRISSRIFTLLFLFIFSSSTFSARIEPVRAKSGMVVSANVIASQVGIEILKKGGNAVDAAVAVGFALAVTYPPAGNLGGGGFMVIHTADNNDVTIDFRERAPSSASRDMYLNKDGVYIPKLSQEGMTSSAVPGSVDGLIAALEEYGTMTLSQVIQPAINLADIGFELDFDMAGWINKEIKEFEKYESSRKIFLNNGQNFKAGDLFIQKDLANTLRLINEEGRAGFYTGYVADCIVAQSEKLNGYISLEDLKNYKSVIRKPVTGEYRGNKIISMGPPSSGGIALIQALNILENFSFKNEEWGSSIYIHKLCETLKYVYADRSRYLGDSEFCDVPVDWLILKEYARDIFNKISDETIQANKISPGTPNFYESNETTHFSVVDKFGNAVSTTTTINSWFGNKVVVEGAGFLMNNEMDDFSSAPGEPNLYGLIGNEANSIQPYKRMLSSMSPTIIIKNDKPYILAGAAGGSKIITTVLQIILNVIDFNMNIAEAMSVPRIHHQWLPDRIDFEKFGLSSDMKNILLQMGYKLGEEKVIGVANCILIDQELNLITGSSDQRKYGKAIGY